MRILARKVVNERGFNLLEVMIALVITAAAAILLSNAWSSNLLRVRKAALYNNVAQLLERKVTEIKAKNSKKKFAEIAEEEGDFGKDFPQYRWTFSKQPFVMPDLAAMASANKDGADQMLILILTKFKEIAGKAILEANVTVYVKQGEKEVPFSASFYIVDYDSPIPLSL